LGPFNPILFLDLGIIVNHVDLTATWACGFFENELEAFYPPSMNNWAL
jgi:hypothetical protein